jgi:deoxycytidylate deaminase
MKANYFLNLAKKASKSSDHHSHQIGAILVKKNKIIGMGSNKIKTHPKSNHPFSMTHAELSAILSADNSKEVEGCDIYVYRETKDGIYANSQPCQHCESLLKSFGIKNVIHTVKNGYNLKKLVKKVG